MAGQQSRSTKDDLSKLSKDWQRLRQQKQRRRGGVEARMLLALTMYFGEHGCIQTPDSITSRALTRDEGNNQLALIFNLVRKLARKKMGHIYKVLPQFGASPNKIDPKAFAKADVVNDLMLATDLKLREKFLHWQRVWWLVLTGVCIEHTPWVEDVADEPLPAVDPTTGELLWRDHASNKVIPQSLVERLVTEQQIPPERFEMVEHMQTVGDVQSQILSGLNFFIDSAVLGIDQLPHDQRCYIAEVKSHDWIKATFGAQAIQHLSSNVGDDLSIIKTRLLDKGPSYSGTNLRDMLPAIQSSRTHDDPPMSIVLTGYQPACKEYPKGRRVILVPDQDILDSDDIPYSEIPLTDYHFEAPTVSFWTEDFVTDLTPAQKFLNKRMSQMGMSANASIHEILLLGGELGKDDIPADIPGVVEDGLTEDGTPKVQALQRGQLPAWFMESIKSVVDFLNNVGGSDLMTHQQFPGQLRGPLALPMLQELIDSEDGPFYAHLGEQLARAKQQRINRIKEYYPPVRTLHYTGHNNRDEVLIFHTDDILRSGTDFNITVDQSSLVPELSALRRARVIEDLSGPLSILYTNRRTGKLDSSKIALAVHYTDKEVEDREVKFRKLAQHYIKKIWDGEQLPRDPQGQLALPRPFWDHNAVLDELEAEMASTEFEEASPAVQGEFIAFYERGREYLAAIQQSQMDAVQGQMMQGAVAQAVQQSAAKAASFATDAALEQVYTQAQMARQMPPGDRLAQAMPGAQVPGAGGPPQPGQPPAPQAPGPSRPQ